MPDLPDPRLPALDDGPGPASPLTAAATERLLEAALDEGLPAPRRRVAPWLIASAAALFLGLPAGAAIWQATRVTPAPKARPRPVRPEAKAPEPAPPAPPAPTPAPAVTSTPAQASRDATRTKKKRRRRTKARRAQPVAPAPAPSAAELLERASRARGAREWQDALQAYDRLLLAYPTSGAAYVAHVSRATIALEHLGRAKAAARGFSAALRLRPGGPLDAEARWGLARAQRRLGRTDDERASLQRLLRDHPRGANAAPARSRLEALGEAP